jgi:hypothetical protein
VFPVRYELNMYDVFWLQKKYVKYVDKGWLEGSVCIRKVLGPIIFYTGFPGFPLSSSEC